MDDENPTVRELGEHYWAVELSADDERRVDVFLVVDDSAGPVWIKITTTEEAQSREQRKRAPKNAYAPLSPQEARQVAVLLEQVAEIAEGEVGW